MFRTDSSNHEMNLCFYSVGKASWYSEAQESHRSEKPLQQRCGHSQGRSISWLATCSNPPTMPPES
ncbi:rCG23708 [Rattus norvegicus]|uniref:RCG23708 n=1 Tax=Rattus norvegicus TaxID=10116 RepID=A6JWF6_RAT|nr:rCG23708 [Rattus norvegicus]